MFGDTENYYYDPKTGTYECKTQRKHTEGTATKEDYANLKKRYIDGWAEITKQYGKSK